MKQAIFSISFAFVLLMSIASCSHSSGVPFLDRLGINTDSVLFDSLPNPCYLQPPGATLTCEQCDSLHAYFYDSKIVSIKQFGENYLLTFVGKGMYSGVYGLLGQGLFSILYDNNGQALDVCCYGFDGNSPEIKKAFEAYEDSLKAIGVKRAEVKFIRAPGLVYTYDFNWEHRFVDSDKLEVTGRIHGTDSIVRYLYQISDSKITQIERSLSNDMRLDLLDKILALPVSQTYEACNLMSKFPDEPKAPHKGCGGSPSYFWIELMAYYNIQPMLKWIADHPSDDYVYNALDWLKRECLNEKSNRWGMGSSFPKDFIENQIMQMEDKEARDYILNRIAEEKAKWEAYLKQYE